MSRTKTIHPKVKKKELTQLADTITSMCLNRGHLQADELSNRVRKLLLAENFRKRNYRIVEEEQQIN
jgi:hypothetical protein